MRRALALEGYALVAAAAEKLCFTHSFGQTFLLFQPVARWLLRRSVALQRLAAGLGFAAV